MKTHRKYIEQSYIIFIDVNEYESGHVFPDLGFKDDDGCQWLRLVVLRELIKKIWLTGFFYSSSFFSVVECLCSATALLWFQKVKMMIEIFHFYRAFVDVSLIL